MRHQGVRDSTTHTLQPGLCSLPRMPGKVAPVNGEVDQKVVDRLIDLELSHGYTLEQLYAGVVELGKLVDPEDGWFGVPFEQVQQRLKERMQ